MRACCPVPHLHFYNSGNGATRDWWASHLFNIIKTVPDKGAKRTSFPKFCFVLFRFIESQVVINTTEITTKVANGITARFSYKPEPGSLLIKGISFELLWGRSGHPLHAGLCKLSHLHCRTLHAQSPTMQDSATQSPISRDSASSITYIAELCKLRHLRYQEGDTFISCSFPHFSFQGNGGGGKKARVPHH